MAGAGPCRGPCRVGRSGGKDAVAFGAAATGGGGEVWCLGSLGSLGGWGSQWFRGLKIWILAP